MVTDMNTNSQRKETHVEFAFRWSIPLGARRVMDAVKESQKSTLSSGKMVALAAGLSVGATVGYIIYRHMSSSDNGECRSLSNNCISVNHHFYISKLVYI